MLGTLGRLLAKPEVQTGLLLGGLAAARAYQPSLIDRSGNDQALITAGSIAAGYVAGNAAGRVLGAAGVRTGLDRSYRAMLLGASAALIGADLKRQLRAYADDGRPVPPGAEVATSLATGAAIAAGVWGVVAAERGAAAAASRSAADRLGGPGWLWRTGAHAALISAGAIAAKTAAGRFLAALDAAADQMEPGYTEPPLSPLLSGGPGSLVGYESLSAPGRRFVTEAASSERINAVMEATTAIDPIRVYVGIDAASSVGARVDLAIAELRRTGVYDRGLLVVGAPSGSGYLNYITVEAAEYFTLGDVATVTMQYGKRPSILSFDRLELAQRHQRTLLGAIRDDLSARPPQDRPRLVLYGESLGAQASQDAFHSPGADTLKAHLVDRALWVGTPYPTRFRRAVLSANPGDASFGWSATIGDLDPEARYHFLDHHEDPVTLFTPSIFYRRPPWLGPPSDRPPNVSKAQRWVPAVTFWQTVFDTKNATEIVPGEFNAFGHDYRADLAAFVRAAFAIENVNDEQMRRVEAALRRSEIERAAKAAAR